MPNRISDGELLAELRDLADELGRTPTTREVNEHGRYSKVTYHRRFGSYTKACEQAGIDPPGEWHRLRRETQDAIGDVISGLENEVGEDGGESGA